jgi:hypothetical protein
MRISARARGLNDDASRAGTILAIGEARPECFGGGNWPRAIPIVWDKAAAPRVPEGTLWLHFDDPQHGRLVIGIAAPGIAQLGIAAGDHASIEWPISVGGEWGWGTAQLHVEGRGRVQMVLNDLQAQGLSFGRAACTRTDACPGEEHVLQLSAQGIEAEVGSATPRGGVMLTNAEAIVRGPNFIETHEGYTGPPGCQGQKRASLAAIVTAEAPQ